MEVPRLGVESELLLPTYATATAMPDLSHNCNLLHSLRQCRILNPLSETRDQTCTFTDTVLGSWSTEPQWERQKVVTHYYWLCSVYVPYIPVTYLSCSWKSVPFMPLHLFCLSLSHSGNCQFVLCISESVSVLCLFICCAFYFYLFYFTFLLF